MINNTTLLRAVQVCFSEDLTRARHHLVPPTVNPRRGLASVAREPVGVPGDDFFAAAADTINRPAFLPLSRSRVGHIRHQRLDRAQQANRAVLAYKDTFVHYILMTF